MSGSVGEMEKEEKITLDNPLTRAQEEVISFFCDGVRVLGLPRSIGEIYGLLFISEEPLSLDDLVEKLGISKGSASQGLKFLKNLGALEKVEKERKSHYSPVTNLKSLVAGFIREEVVPHMNSGQEKLKKLKVVFDEDKDEVSEGFYEERHEKLDRWTKQGKIILPLVQRVLGN